MSRKRPTAANRDSGYETSVGEDAPRATRHAPRVWRLPDRVLIIERRPLVMGIINVTPDSFSDGGQFASTEAAVAHGLKLAGQGADILDIGGESTRPGAASVPVEEELQRVVPVVEALANRTAVLLSVDTSKAAVARASLAAGAKIVNDVAALTGDPDLSEVVCNARTGVILMHRQGTPATMQDNPQYEDVVAEIGEFFQERLQTCSSLGLAKEQIVLDPGIGFGKTLEHNLLILASLEEYQRFGRPVCLGVSRKAFIGQLLGNRPVSRRLAGSLAVLCHAMCRQAVQIVRVHDVEETHDALLMVEAILKMTR